MAFTEVEGATVRNHIRVICRWMLALRARCGWELPPVGISRRSTAYFSML